LVGIQVAVIGDGVSAIRKIFLFRLRAH